MSDIVQEQQNHDHNNNNNNNNETVPCSSSSSSLLPSDTEEELQHMPLAPVAWKKGKRLSKQLSMCEKPRDIAWERKRRMEQRRSAVTQDCVCGDELIDEDLHELKGCIELGFGFNEEDGQRLCNTLPALDLYFAVNRGLSPSPVSTPQSRASSFGARSSSFGSPRSDSDSWKICSPGHIPPSNYNVSCFYIWFCLCYLENVSGFCDYFQNFLAKLIIWCFKLFFKKNWFLY